VAAVVAIRRLTRFVVLALLCGASGLVLGGLAAVSMVAERFERIAAVYDQLDVDSFAEVVVTTGALCGCAAGLLVSPIAATLSRRLSTVNACTIVGTTCVALVPIAIFAPLNASELGNPLFLIPTMVTVGYWVFALQSRWVARRHESSGETGSVNPDPT